jgi:hypothetical protein
MRVALERAEGDRAIGSKVSCAGPWLALAAGVGAWLWPLGVGGRMPVGGDVTQFQIGLMAVLHRALRSWRLPLWNDLWGYGFPGVAESQMGVFYPPHLLLYGLLPTELAYTISLVAHTAWGAIGAAWAARRFGVSRWGSALAGFAWASCGFFLIHLPHQWGYTSGSWMPWAWGLAWSLVRGEAGRRTALLLAAVLAVQTLPGHFQLAFETQVGVLGMVLWALIERPGGWRRAIVGALAVSAALAAVAALAAMQLWPTYRLARLAESRRDEEYLSGFAVAPLHLVSYVAPGLFHRSPLWRPLAWDAFRTSPEEHLGYVGLVPLFLALGAIRSGFRRDPAVRAATFLAALTLYLSLGPNVAGFRWLIQLPGFSFFRAPARWGLATALALALLAGKGFDGLPSGRRPGRALAWFVLGAGVAILWAILRIELAFPFHGPTAMSDLHPNLRDDERRALIYARELGPTALWLAVLLVLALFARQRRAFRAALIAVAMLDLLVLGQRKPMGFAPIRPLTAQSPVLARLAREPRGTRILLGRISNLPQAAGVAALPSYRTLDLPVLEGLTATAQNDFHGTAEGIDLFPATGAALRLYDPGERIRRGRYGRVERIDDPALAGWIYDSPWVPAEAKGTWPTTFTLGRAPATPQRAWLLPASSPANPTGLGHLRELLAAAAPLEEDREVPERVAIRVHADRPGYVVVSQLDYPEWKARWDGPGGPRPASIFRVFGTPRGGAWQGVTVPGPGDWTLHLEYRGQDVSAGSIVSAVAWALWAGALAWRGVGRKA